MNKIQIFLLLLLLIVLLAVVVAAMILGKKSRDYLLLRKESNGSEYILNENNDSQSSSNARDIKQDTSGIKQDNESIGKSEDDTNLILKFVNNVTNNTKDKHSKRLTISGEKDVDIVSTHILQDAQYYIVLLNNVQECLEYLETCTDESHNVKSAQVPKCVHNLSGYFKNVTAAMLLRDLYKISTEELLRVKEQCVLQKEYYQNIVDTTGVIKTDDSMTIPLELSVQGKRTPDDNNLSDTGSIHSEHTHVSTTPSDDLGKVSSSNVSPLELSVQGKRTPDDNNLSDTGSIHSEHTHVSTTPSDDLVKVSSSNVNPSVLHPFIRKKIDDSKKKKCHAFAKEAIEEEAQKMLGMSYEDIKAEKEKLLQYSQKMTELCAKTKKYRFGYMRLRDVPSLILSSKDRMAYHSCMPYLFSVVEKAKKLCDRKYELYQLIKNSRVSALINLNNQLSYEKKIEENHRDLVNTGDQYISMYRIDSLYKDVNVSRSLHNYLLRYLYADLTPPVRNDSGKIVQQQFNDEIRITEENNFGILRHISDEEDKKFLLDVLLEGKKKGFFPVHDDEFYAGSGDIEGYIVEYFSPEEVNTFHPGINNSQYLLQSDYVKEYNKWPTFDNFDSANNRRRHCVVYDDFHIRKACINILNTKGRSHPITNDEVFDALYAGSGRDRYNMQEQELERAIVRAKEEYKESTQNIAHYLSSLQKLKKFYNDRQDVWSYNILKEEGIQCIGNYDKIDILIQKIRESCDILESQIEDIVSAARESVQKCTRAEMLSLKCCADKLIASLLEKPLLSKKLRAELAEYTTKIASSARLITGYYKASENNHSTVETIRDLGIHVASLEMEIKHSCVEIEEIKKREVAHAIARKAHLVCEKEIVVPSLISEIVPEYNISYNRTLRKPKGMSYQEFWSRIFSMMVLMHANYTRIALEQCLVGIADIDIEAELERSKSMMLRNPVYFTDDVKKKWFATELDEVLIEQFAGVLSIEKQVGRESKQGDAPKSLEISKENIWQVGYKMFASNNVLYDCALVQSNENPSDDYTIKCLPSIPEYSDKFAWESQETFQKRQQRASEGEVKELEKLSDCVEGVDNFIWQRNPWLLDEEYMEEFMDNKNELLLMPIEYQNRHLMAFPLPGPGSELHLIENRVRIMRISGKMYARDLTKADDTLCDYAKLSYNCVSDLEKEMQGQYAEDSLEKELQLHSTTSVQKTQKNLGENGVDDVSEINVV